MRKIPSLFIRDWDHDRSRVTREVNPNCQWVIDGEGVPTEKFDGTACMIKEGVLYKRYDRKKLRKGINKGQYKPAPEGWIPCQDPDENTGHYPGWLPVDFSLPDNKWHKQAWEKYNLHNDGTYELVGLKRSGNPYHLEDHELWKHGSTQLCDLKERTFEDIKFFLELTQIEGIVWHHKDGRMAKIKRVDFGLDWPIKNKRG